MKYLILLICLKKGERKDKHLNIGNGTIPINSFKQVYTYCKKYNTDMILETPHDKIINDIKLIKSFNK
jgi:endonuclease IV